MDISGQLVRAAVERQHRHRPGTAALLDAMKPRHGRVLADPGQFRRDCMDRAVRHRRRRREPGRQPRRQRRFRDAHLAAFRIDEEGRRKRQQRQGRSRAVARHDLLLAGLADRPAEFAPPRIRPGERGAPDVAGSRAPGLDDPADQPDQLLAVRPVVAPRIAAAGIEVEPSQDRGVFRGQVLVRPGRRPLAILPEIGADRAVLAQIGPVRRDVDVPRLIAVDHVEQVLPPQRRRTGGGVRAAGPVVLLAGGRLRPSVEPPADHARNSAARRSATGIVPVRREMAGGEQHGGGVLAVVADRAGAMPFDRKKSPLAPGFVLRHDRIGFLPAARNLAVDPAGRPEFDRTHHAAFEIVQTPQERDLPDRALDVVCPEGFQAGLSASSAKGSCGGLQRSCADAPSCKTAASDPLGSAPGETARTNLFSNGRMGQVRSRHSIPARASLAWRFYRQRATCSAVPLGWKVDSLAPRLAVRAFREVSPVASDDGMDVPVVGVDPGSPANSP